MTELEKLMDTKIDSIKVLDSCHTTILRHFVKRHFPSKRVIRESYSEVAQYLSDLLQERTDELLSLRENGVSLDSMIGDGSLTKDLVRYLKDVEVIKKRIIKDVEKAHKPKFNSIDKYIEMYNNTKRIKYYVKHPLAYRKQFGVGLREEFDTLEEAKEYRNMVFDEMVKAGSTKNKNKLISLGSLIVKEQTPLGENVAYTVFHNKRVLNLYDGVACKSFKTIQEAIDYKLAVERHLEEIRNGYRRIRMKEFINYKKSLGESKDKK